MEATIELMESKINNMLNDIELVEIVEGHIRTRRAVGTGPDPELQELIRQRRQVLIRIYEALFHIDVHASLFKEMVDARIESENQRVFLKRVEHFVRQVDSLLAP